MEFEFKGKIRIKGEWRPFTRLIKASTENFAREKLYGLFGSEHGIPRRFVKIESVIKQEDTKNKKE
ncbi:MAG: 50S ribosomal protein L18Ae [Candidatus Diapherotrites archaeon]